MKARCEYLHGNRLLKLSALLNLKHEIAAVDIFHDEVQAVHGLETRVKLDQERGLAGLGQHALLHHRALDVVVLDDDVLFEDFDCVKLVGSLALGQHDFAERTLAENHQEVEVSGSNDVLLAHVVWHILVGDYRRFLCDRSLSHLDLQLGQVGAVVGHRHVVELTFLRRQELEPPIARVFDDFRDAK